MKTLNAIIVIAVFFLTSPVFASDIIFSKGCLADVTTTVELDSLGAVSPFGLYLQKIGNRQRYQTENINELLEYSKVKFPSGDAIDMRKPSVFAHDSDILKRDYPIIDWYPLKDGLKNKSDKLYESSKFKEMGGSLSEYIALYVYKDVNFSEINRALRHMNFKSTEDEKAFITFVKYLNSALDRIPPYKGYVKREAAFAPEVLDQFKPGGYFSTKSYFSTTLKSQVLFAASGTSNLAKFILKSKTGKSIESIMFRDSLPTSGEGEVLFKPQTIFKVLKVERPLIKDRGDYKETTKIYAEEMP